MMIKQFFLLAIPLIILLVMVWWHPYKFPSDIKWAIDNFFSATFSKVDSFFSATISKKDDSFSNILSKDDKGFARTLKPREFKFPADHGAHNSYRTEKVVFHWLSEKFI